jgi:hypothetical protein
VVANVTEIGQIRVAYDHLRSSRLEDDLAEMITRDHRRESGGGIG